MSQVHKETLTAVDNALPNRVGLDIEIFGMEGIPEEIVQQHNQRVLQTYHQQQADRAHNQGGGGAGGNANKKPKVEDKMSLKERLAMHKAAKAAAQEGDVSTSGGNTPVASTVTPAPGTFVRLLTCSTPFQFTNMQQTGPSYQQPYTAPPVNGSYSQPLTYNPVQAVGTPGYQAVQQPAPYGHNPGQPVPYAQPQPYAQPLGANFQQPPSSYSSQPAFSPAAYQQPGSFPGQYPPNSTSPYPGQVAPRPYGAGSPPFNSHVSPPPQPNSFPKPVHTGTVSLPTAPGLPQRPMVGAPPVSGFQFQQMHQGAIPAPHSHSPQPYPQQEVPPSAVAPVANSAEMPTASSIDDLISSAAKQADPTPSAQPPAAAPLATNGTSTAAPAPVLTKEKPAPTEEKKEKSDKSKKTRLVYSDEHLSPEEKMALLPRFAFTPRQAAAAT
jgi:hypothetical protein